MQSNANAFSKCFEPIYLGIFRTRILIEMHSNIAAIAKQLINQNFWGVFQNNILIGAVIIELFSMLEDNPVHKNILNKLNGCEKDKWDCLLKKLRKKIENHKEFRKSFAHKSKDKHRGHSVDYKEILRLIGDFERALDSFISNRYDYYFLSTVKTLNSKDFREPTIIKQIAKGKTNYYYTNGDNCGFITIGNIELKTIKFPSIDKIERIASTSFPKKT